ncbi:MAG: hypothetical protein QM687_08705 [Ferruginibacter sp.]
MKIPIFGIFLKGAIIALVAFSVYGLLLQFIFSYLNQDKYGPALTICNFAGPLFLTISILLFSGLGIVKPTLVNRLSFNTVITIVLSIVLVVLIIWQIWYAISLYKIKERFSLEALVPVVTGLLATLFFSIHILKRKKEMH